MKFILFCLHFISGSLDEASGVKGPTDSRILLKERQARVFRSSRPVLRLEQGDLAPGFR